MLKMNFLRRLKNLIETNKFLSAIFDKIAGSFLYKTVIYKKIKKYTSDIKKLKNYNIVIETSNACNAKCIMCPHVKMQRKQEIMTQEIFDKIVEKLLKDNIKPLAFILNGFGDPLTDKSISNRIQTLKDKFPDSITKFYSNLGLANKEIDQSLLDSGLDEINISFNGFNKENYEKTMGISYDKTQGNLEELIKMRNDQKSPLKIRLSMTLVTYNDGNEKEFIKRWKGRVDSVSVNKVHTYGNSIKDTSGKNKINFNKLVYPCKYIWNTMVFSVHGDIFICCLDYEGRHNFGNILDKNRGALDIFYGERFEAIRKMHLENNIKKVGICSSCYTPYKNGVEWLINDLY